MKRIAYLCLSEAWGGLEMNQLRNAIVMQKRGHDVLIITNKNSPIAQRALTENILLYIVNQKTKHYQWRFAWKLGRFLMSKNINNLIFRNNREQSIAASVAFLSIGKIKVHYFMEMALGGRRNQLFRTLRYYYFKSWSCPLPYLKDQVLALTNVNAKKVCVIPSGIQASSKPLISKKEARQMLGWPQNKKLLVMVGRIDPKKRQEYVFDMFIKRQCSDEILVFVGENTLDEPSDYFTALKNTVDASAKKSQILFAGFQNNMKAVYAAADVMIMAANNETVGMATLESLLYNCPVLGVNNGGTKSIISDFGGGLLYDTNDDSAFIAQLDRLLNEDFPPLDKTRFEQHFDFQHVCQLIETSILI